MQEISRKKAIEELEKEKEEMREKEERIRYCNEYKFVYDNKFYSLLYSRFLSFFILPISFTSCYYLFFCTKWSYPLCTVNPDYLGACLMIPYITISVVVWTIMLKLFGVEDSVAKFTLPNLCE